MQMVQDAFIVLTPPILMLVGVLWFYSNDLLPMRFTHVLTSFLSLYLTSGKFLPCQSRSGPWFPSSVRVKRSVRNMSDIFSQ